MAHLPYEPIFEKITIPLEIDDTILIGKFKNKRVVVKGYGKDDKGQPTVRTDKGEIPLFKFRIAKLIPENS